MTAMLRAEYQLYVCDVESLEWCNSSCVVECRSEAKGCRFEYRSGVLRTEVYSAFHPSAVSR